MELAQLDYLSTRLVRGWTHLERQKGGIGLRGPGETSWKPTAACWASASSCCATGWPRCKKQRQVQQRSRSRSGVMSVSIVGYTNAGKSRLVQRLTKAGAYAADQLFATFDTTSRRLYLNANCSVVLSDTVGFIRDLPHSLVAAFRYTLEETVHADLLLHVVDSANDQRDRQIEDVNKVLAEISADGIPQLLVLNKTDLKGLPGGIERDENGIFMQCAYLRSLAKGWTPCARRLWNLRLPQLLSWTRFDIHDTSENTWQ